MTSPEAVAAAQAIIDAARVQQPATPNGDGIKRFTSRRKNVTFYIDDEMFEAYGAAPADFMENLANSLEDVGGTKGMDAYRQLRDAIGVLLMPDSAQRFAARRSSFENPVTISCLTDVATHLMTELSGSHPTQPPSRSAITPVGTGVTSTDGAPVEGTTP